MQFADVVRRRRMIRSYDASRPVPGETLDALVSAALRAPSAGHSQGVSLLVLQGPEETDRYWAATSDPGRTDRWLRGMRTAPVLIVVWTSAEAYLDRYARADKGWHDRDPGRWSAPYWYVDAGMASMSALFAAVDTELGACFFGVPPERQTQLRSTFGVPPEQLSVGVISVGYPDPAATSRPSAGRRPRPERVHHGHWTEG